MNASPAASPPTRLWERLVAVNVPDEEEQRRGRLFNILLVMTVVIVILIAAILTLTQVLGVSASLPLIIALPLPLAFIPIAALCWVLVRRGHVRATITLYVWLNFAGLALSAWLFDGIGSPAWFLFAWTVTAAGTLLVPGYALLIAGLVLAYFTLLLTLTQAGLYVPPFELGPAGNRFVAIAFGLLIMVAVIGVLTFLNTASLRTALRRLRRTGRELDQERRTLEQRVAERTQDLEHRSQQLQAITEISRDLALVHELDRLWPRAAQLVHQRLDLGLVNLFVLDEPGTHVILRAASGEPGQQLAEQGFRLPVNDPGLVGQVVRSGRHHSTTEPLPETPHVAAATRAEIVLPLRAGDVLVGALDLQRPQAADWDPNDAAILQILADQLALTIQNARLLYEAQLVMHELQTTSAQYTRDSWQSLGRPTDRPAGYRYRQLDLEPLAEQPPEARQAWLQGRSLITTIHPTARGSQRPSSNILAVPLKLRDQVIGVLDVRLEGATVAPEVVSLIEQVANRLALALENARLLEETRRRAEQERLISEITERMRRVVDVETILQTTVTELGQALGAPRAYVRLGVDLGPEDGLRPDGSEDMS